MHGGQIMLLNFSYTYALLPGLLSNGKPIGNGKRSMCKLLVSDYQYKVISVWH